jgi:hypothetical protein
MDQFIQTWNKLSLGQVSSNERDFPSRGGGNSKSKNTLNIFKNLLHQNQQAKINQI